MNPSLFSSQNNSEKQAISDLLRLGGEIEHKFTIGRAIDIRPDFVHSIITKTIIARNIARNSQSINRLIEIENIAYAILDSEKAPDYYRYLRTLMDLLQALDQFE